jgi:hypothetical protein
MDFVDLVPGFGHDGDQRRRHRRVGGEAALHDHRGARRNVVAEYGVPGEMIGGNRSRHRVILIEPDGMRQVGAEFAQHTTHPLQDEIALTAAALAAMKRKPRRPGNLVRGAGLPIVRFVPGKENPRTGFDGIGIRDRCPKKAVDRLYIQHHLVAPLQHLS